MGSDMLCGDPQIIIFEVHPSWLLTITKGKPVHQMK